jgi:hypothetical protein
MDRQEIIAILDRAAAGRHRGSDTADVHAYREELADALMQLDQAPDLEAALKAAYEKGFHDARYYPHLRMPALTIDWTQPPHVVAQWPEPSWTAGDLPMPVFDHNEEVPD